MSCGRALLATTQGHDTAVPASGTWPRFNARERCDTASQATTRPAGAYDTVLGAATIRPHAWPGRACAHLGVLAGSTGCALGAPSLFLDSVLFLSH